MSRASTPARRGSAGSAPPLCPLPGGGAAAAAAAAGDALHLVAVAREQVAAVRAGARALLEAAAAGGGEAALAQVVAATADAAAASAAAGAALRASGLLAPAPGDDDPAALASAAAVAQAGRVRASAGASLAALDLALRAAHPPPPPPPGVARPLAPRSEGAKRAASARLAALSTRLARTSGMRVELWGGAGRVWASGGGTESWRWRPPPSAARAATGVWLHAGAAFTACVALASPGAPAAACISVHAPPSAAAAAGAGAGWALPSGPLGSALTARARRAHAFHLARAAAAGVRPPGTPAPTASPAECALEDVLLWLAAGRHTRSARCGRTGALLAADAGRGGALLPPTARPHALPRGDLARLAAAAGAGGVAFHAAAAPADAT